MKGKIFTILGILIVLLAGFSYVLFEYHVKETSNLLSSNVIVAKTDIQMDTVIKSEAQASEMFFVKRVNVNDLVSGAIAVSSNTNNDNSIMSKIKSIFITPTPDTSQLSQLVGLKITRNYKVNEQILSDYVSKDIEEFGSEDRIYSPNGKILINSTIATELHAGDYVDLWIIQYAEDGGQPIASSFYGPLKIYKLKDAEGNVLTGQDTSAAVYPTFKISNKDIALIESTLNQENCTSFIVKYGSKPTNLEIENAIFDSQEKDLLTEKETKEVNIVETINSDTLIEESIEINDDEQVLEKSTKINDNEQVLEESTLPVEQVVEE